MSMSSTAKRIVANESHYRMERQRIVFKLN